MVIHTPHMAKDNLGAEGDGAHVRDVTWEVSEGVVLLKPRWSPLLAVVALDQLLLIVAGVCTATMDGKGDRCGDVGKIANMDQ